MLRRKGITKCTIKTLKRKNKSKRQEEIMDKGNKRKTALNVVNKIQQYQSL